MYLICLVENRDQIGQFLHGDNKKCLGIKQFTTYVCIAICYTDNKFNFR